MDSVYRKMAGGYAYFYAGAFAVSFSSLGLAALVFLLVIVAGFVGIFN